MWTWEITPHSIISTFFHLNLMFLLFLWWKCKVLNLRMWNALIRIFSYSLFPVCESFESDQSVSVWAKPSHCYIALETLNDTTDFTAPGGAASTEQFNRFYRCAAWVNTNMTRRPSWTTASAALSEHVQFLQKNPLHWDSLKSVVGSWRFFIFHMNHFSPTFGSMFTLRHIWSFATFSWNLNL